MPATDSTSPVVEDTEPQSALHRHAQHIWEAMHSESKVEALDNGDDGDVYTGFLTHLFNENDVPIPYYTVIMRLLKKSDCVFQLRRGGGAAESKWLLRQFPTEELLSAVDPSTANLYGRTNKTAQLEQRMRDLHNRLSDLEHRVERLGA